MSANIISVPTMPAVTTLPATPLSDHLFEHVNVGVGVAYPYFSAAVSAAVSGQSQRSLSSSFSGSLKVCARLLACVLVTSTV